MNVRLSQGTKLFISQPISGRTDEEIINEQDTIRDKIKDKYDDVELVNTFLTFAPFRSSPMMILGMSIKMLFGADVAVFAKGWEKEKECQVEHIVCEKYGIKIIEL